MLRNKDMLVRDLERLRKLQTCYFCGTMSHRMLQDAIDSIEKRVTALAGPPPLTGKALQDVADAENEDRTEDFLHQQEKKGV